MGRGSVMPLGDRDVVLLRTLFDNATDAILVLEGGRVVECNPHAETMFGVPREEILGSTAADFAPDTQPDGRSSTTASQEWIARALAGPAQRFEWLVRRRDGGLVTVEVALKRIVVGDTVLLQALMHDISVRKRFEQDLADERRYSDAIIEALPGGFSVLDDRGALVRTNPLGAEDLGLRDVHAGISVFEVLDAESRTKAEAALAEAIARGVAEVDLHFVPPGGKPRWRHVVVRRFDVRGRPYLVTVGIDITERLEAAARLEVALAEVTRLRDQLRDENVILREEVATRAPGAIVGRSPALMQALEQIGHVAPTDATVLLLGETGVGKELFAAAIHQGSPRRAHPMVRVNCAAMPPALLESELFGREKGAYTGALSRQVGRFELANGSTIFLDEVGELTLEAQAKLLRVLESREIERLGSPTPVSVDVRVVAATNRDLAAEVQAGRFRADLFYRLNVFPVAIPPLRERLADVPELVWHFVQQLGKTMGKRIDAIVESDMEALGRYSWPGNIRELRNVVERSMIVATGSELRLLGPGDTRPPQSETERILAALVRCGWRIRGREGAAEALGLKPTTLETRMLRLGIKRPGRGT